jgi:hypothetical protein
MQRIRKDSETLSNSGYSAISRARRESDRLRTEVMTVENANTMAHRNVRNPSVVSEVIKSQKNDQPFDFLYFLRKQKFIVYHNQQIQLVYQVQDLMKIEVYYYIQVNDFERIRRFFICLLMNR